jgi:hypothetical protein
MTSITYECLEKLYESSEKNATAWPARYYRYDGDER